MWRVSSVPTARICTTRLTFVRVFLSVLGVESLLVWLAGEPCLPVHGIKDAHRHRLIPQADISQILVLPTLAETIENRFQCWGVRAFVGSRSSANGLVYTRFDEIYRSARALATWTNACDLAPSSSGQQHVAIVADNGVGWIVAEIATVFANAVR